MNNILSIIEGYTIDNADDVARALADDFRSRRVKKNLTRVDATGLSEGEILAL